ncbi:MAG: hypothetical protein ACMZ64_12080 [Oleiphilus sp.]
MLVLKIIGVLIILGGAYRAIVAINDFSHDKYGYCFFTPIAFYTLAASWALFLVGYLWFDSSAGIDKLNGAIIIVIGLSVALYQIYYNFKRSSLLFGLGGTVLQLSVFGILAYIGTIFLVIGVVCVVALAFLSPTQSVYVVNK